MKSFFFERKQRKENCREILTWIKLIIESKCHDLWRFTFIAVMFLIPQSISSLLAHSPQYSQVNWMCALTHLPQSIQKCKNIFQVSLCLMIESQRAYNELSILFCGWNDTGRDDAANDVNREMKPPRRKCLTRIVKSSAVDIKWKASQNRDLISWLKLMGLSARSPAVGEKLFSSLCFNSNRCNFSAH